MDSIVEVSDVTLFFDTFSTESKNLYESFNNTGVKVNVVSIEDDGYLPDGVITPYGYFLGEFAGKSNVPGKPLYFNQIKIPELWEITGNSSGGKIMDNSVERGRMFFSDTDNSRLVRIVDWLDEKGVARFTEHYNKYGAVFCKTFFDSKGNKSHRSFYNAEGEEIIYENFVTSDFLVKYEGKDYVIHTKNEFIKFFFKCSGFENTNIIFNTLATPFLISESLPKTDNKDVLFWNEPIKDSIPGNMTIILNGNSNRATKVYVQRHEAYERLIELGASEDIVKELGYVYGFLRENNHTNNVLVMTNSDNIEKLEEIVKTTPNMHFHIAALTEMSSKLMAVEKYDNISLYPGAKKSAIDRLFATCDIYLDINNGGEIVDAVHRAFLNKQLILGFENTLHNRSYISPTNIFSVEEYDALIMVLNAITDNPELIDMALEQQLSFALAEDSEKYDMNSMFL